MASTRWTLRRAVCRLNGVLHAHALEKRPRKIFIVRINKGFDFLGYHFGKGRLELAEKALNSAIMTLHRF